MNEPNAGAPRNLNTTTQNTLFCHARMCKQLGVLGLHPVASGPSGPHRVRRGFQLPVSRRRVL